MAYQYVHEMYIYRLEFSGHICLSLIFSTGKYSKDFGLRDKCLRIVWHEIILVEQGILNTKMRGANLEIASEILFAFINCSFGDFQTFKSTLIDLHVSDLFQYI